MEQFTISEALKAKIEAADTLEEVAKICDEAGYEVTTEQLKGIDATHKDELNEKDLDNVVGGSLIPVLGVASVIYFVWKSCKTGNSHGGGGHRF